MVTTESEAPRTSSENPAPDPARDEETALRLFPIHDWVEKDSRLSSGAFYVRKTTPSVFVKERLPDEDGDVLHVGRFGSYGRVRVDVHLLKEFKFKRENDGVVRSFGLDLLMTGSADPPLEAFGRAHAELRGITSKKMAQALTALINQHGSIERMPDPQSSA